MGAGAVGDVSVSVSSKQDITDQSKISSGGTFDFRRNLGAGSVQGDGPSWGWIAGGLAALVLLPLGLYFAFRGRKKRG